ncbi:MAG: hypothetical protein ACYCZ6_16255, partial [Polaromonas sp.]
AAALAAGAVWLAQNGTLAQSSAQADLQAAEQALQSTQSDRARLEENLQLFDRLKQLRFVQVPDRLALLEALEAAADDLRQSTLTWELGPQETLKTLNDDQTGTPVAQLVRVPMKLSTSGVHEQEWLALLARLQRSGAGSFTTDDCVYEQKPFSKGGATVPALGVVCNLSWLYVVADAPQARTQTDGAPPQLP